MKYRGLEAFGFIKDKDVMQSTTAGGDCTIRQTLSSSDDDDPDISLPQNRTYSAIVLSSEDEDLAPRTNVHHPTVAQLEALLKPVQLPNNLKFEATSNLDISLAIGQNLTNADKKDFLTSVFVPSKNYKFYPVLQAKRRR